MTYKLIKNGNLMDVNGGTTVENAAVLLQDNTIVGVGPIGQIKQVDDAEVIDADGGYILPGFFDSHLHLTFQVGSMQEKILTPFSMKFYKSISFMRKTLDAGITSVRDAGGADAGLKAAVEQGLVAGPRMQISINALTTTSGHGDSWNLSGIDTTTPSYPGMPSGICDGTEEVRKKVREIFRAGAEVVKVHASGGVLSPTDHPEFTQFSQEELEVIVQEARFRKNLKVMAHAQGAESIKNAVKAGIHSIEHGIFLDDETIELMLENGTYLVPTLLAPVSVLETPNLPDYAMKKASEVADIHRESIAKAHKAGVKIAMGTDAGCFPHGTNLRELELLCDIGMTPMEAILSATKVSSELLGWEDRLGSIEAGKLADVIIVKENPLTNIKALQNTDNIQVVIKDGIIQKDIRVDSAIVTSN
ncbi:metal-dependent hydrolase family protein [Siminovitchia terrae]|uniref:metal-dependent hydrolase family protein n=1 Tax=Siminovitchia terrae TaxID=1914933 RepID=UPI0028ABD74F|nr:amidohydrolase family protein [Siminovitchia terrae]